MGNINAVVMDLSDQAMEQARALDVARASGGECGQLHGVPVTIKVNVDQTGWATTNGLPALKDAVAAELRQLSGGKPVGIKLCIGHPWEFVSIVKAMVETGIQLDFVTVDGSEGGTGAAPVEFTDHLGCPLRDAVVFVDNALKGAGLRDRIKVAASGKLVSAYDIVRICALGADWCNMARPFMFSLGCIQARDCASGHCPTGVATMDKRRFRAIEVKSRAVRVMNFHKNTRFAIKELLEAAGLNHPSELNRRHIVRRLSASQIKLADQVYPKVSDGALLRGEHVEDPRLQSYWSRVSGASFKPDR